MEGKPAGTIGAGIRSLWIFDFDGTLSPIALARAVGALAEIPPRRGKGKS